MSVTFDKVNDLVSIASQTLGATISVTAWIKPLSLGESNVGVIACQESGGTVRWAFQLAANNRLRFFVERSSTDGTWESANSSISTAGIWQHVGVSITTFTTDANDPALYINGVAQTPLTTDTNGSGTEVADGGNFYVGNSSDTARTFEGSIGEVAVWTKALTAEEMAAVYLLGPHAHATSLYLYWPFDAIVGGSLINIGDMSGNGRPGDTFDYTAGGENPPTRPAGRRG